MRCRGHPDLGRVLADARCPGKGGEPRSPHIQIRSAVGCDARRCAGARNTYKHGHFRVPFEGHCHLLPAAAEAFPPRSKAEPAGAHAHMRTCVCAGSRRDLGAAGKSFRGSVISMHIPVRSYRCLHVVHVVRINIPSERAYQFPEQGRVLISTRMDV